jgi:hypothetical protein
MFPRGTFEACFHCLGFGRPLFKGLVLALWVIILQSASPLFAPPPSPGASLQSYRILGKLRVVAAEDPAGRFILVAKHSAERKKVRQMLP